tara:strand:- start:70 stop:468 length:399 start_codon:yes stop_codon:yes gene_type:complete
MELIFKNTFRINLINLIINLLMIISVIFGVFELKNTFSFIDLIAIIYSILFQIMMFVVIYASFRELNCPEFMEFLENGYVQILGFIIINLLLMDTSFVGLVIGSIIIAYSLGLLIYIQRINKIEFRLNQLQT